MDQSSPFSRFYTCSAALDDLGTKILQPRLWVIGPMFLEEVTFHKPYKSRSVREGFTGAVPGEKKQTVYNVGIQNLFKQNSFKEKILLSWRTRRYSQFFIQVLPHQHSERRGSVDGTLLMNECDLQFYVSLGWLQSSAVQSNTNLGVVTILCR